MKTLKTAMMAALVAGGLAIGMPEKANAQGFSLSIGRGGFYGGPGYGYGVGPGYYEPAYGLAGVGRTYGYAPQYGGTYVRPGYNYGYPAFGFSGRDYVRPGFGYRDRGFRGRAFDFDDDDNRGIRFRRGRFR